MVNIFDKKYNAILHPYNLESLNHLALFIKDKKRDLDFENLKLITLNVLEYLIDNDIIYILDPNWMKNKEYTQSKLSKESIINIANEKWSHNISDEEFYDLFWFRFQDWYTTKLVEKGLTYYSFDWNEFINEKIGNLEQWIKENRPKES